MSRSAHEILEAAIMNIIYTHHDWNVIIMKELPVMSRSTREILEAVITNIIYV